MTETRYPINVSQIRDEVKHIKVSPETRRLLKTIVVILLPHNKSVVQIRILLVGNKPMFAI